MSTILNNATAHFRTKLRVIDVPEWGSKIWYKPVTTLKEQSKLVELAQQNKPVEALVETLIMKARNEDGSKMFTMPDKVVFMNEVDPAIIIRVVGEMNDKIDSEDDEAAKN